MKPYELKYKHLKKKREQVGLKKDPKAFIEYSIVQLKKRIKSIGRF